MATPKKPKEQTKNTSAPATPGNLADVLATEAVQTASQASAQPASASSSDGQGDSPPVGDGIGDKIDSLVATAIIVTSRREGFRRAGRAWSKAPTTVPLDELGAAHLDALLAEPVLDVAFLADSVEKAGG